MAISSGDTSIQGLRSALINKFTQVKHESFFRTQSPFLDMLVRKGRIYPFGHGVKKQVPVMFPTSSGPVTEYIDNPYAERTPVATTGFDSYVYTLAQLGKVMAIDEYEKRQAGSSDVEKVNWEGATIEKNLKETYAKVGADLMDKSETAGTNGLSRNKLGSLLTYLNGGGSTTTADTLEPASLAEQLHDAVVTAASATALFNPGGLDRNAALAARLCTPQGMLIGATDQVTISMNVLANTIALANQEGEWPDVALMSFRIWTDLQQVATFGVSNATGGGQFFTDSGTADLGYRGFRFMGCEFFPDRRVPESSHANGTTNGGTTNRFRMYCINTKYLQLHMVSRRPMIEKFVDDKQLDQHKVSWMMQLVGTHLGNVHSFHANIKAL